MFKNYLLLGIRTLLKKKLYSFINIAGLAMGMAVCLVILKYIDFELSYDRFHERSSSIYRVLTETYRNGVREDRGAGSGYIEGPSLQAEVPGIKRYVRTHPMYGGVVFSNNDPVNNHVFFEENVQFVDSTFLDVFTYPALEGNASSALDRPMSAVITASMARKYFGNEADVTGKTLKLSGGWVDGDYTVTAVLKDLPQNAHFTFDCLLSIHGLLERNQYKEDDGWGWRNFVTYVELQSGTDLALLNPRLKTFMDKRQQQDDLKADKHVSKVLQPITNVHLNPNLELPLKPAIITTAIYFFITIAVFILAIAWVNYINLSTARAMERAREVGVKKTIGAYRGQLVFQFLIESLLVNFISVVLAVGITVMLLPVLGNIVGKDLTLDFSDPRLWIMLSSLFIIGTVVSGVYPAFVLSSFKAATILKGASAKIMGQGFSLRRVLVVFQFSSSLILIAGTFAVYRQIQFMRNHEKGMNMNQMLVINGPSVVNHEGAEERLVSFRNELKKIHSVSGVASSAAIPGAGFNWGTQIRRSGDEVTKNAGGNVAWVDRNFIDTYELKLITGKKWDPNAPKETFEGVLINEAAIKAFGLGDAENALNERLVLERDTLKIAGVLKNYHWNSLKSEHVPVLLAPSYINRRYFSIHLSGDIRESVAQVEKLYKEAFPDNPFDYFFMDDFFNKQYRDDQQFATIIGLFAILAIFIACLGLWGLAAFTTTQKLREISIRKVLGASVSSLMGLLSRQFLILAAIASVVAIPVIWYGVDSWLSSFPYRINIAWDLLLVPVIMLGSIAMATISFHIFRGANTNPANVLRSE